MADGKNIRFWTMGAALLLAAWGAGCGGNTTPAGVTVTPTTQTVVVGGSQQFSATVTGASTTTVTWKVCIPGATAVVNGIATNPPTNCGSGNLGTVTSTGLYTAPARVPSPGTLDIVATSTIAPAAFGVAQVTIDPGVRVRLLPTSATIPLSQPGQPSTFQFNATVTGSKNQSLTWTVSNVAGGNSIFGTITPNGLYTAPSAIPGGTITVTATTSAFSSPQSASATVTLVRPAPPAVTTIDPNTAAEGSVQQDIYVIGTDFISTDGVLANGTLVPSIFISTTLLRATIPASALQQTGLVSIQVQRGKVGVGPTAQLTVNPAGPSIIGSSPDSVSQTTAGIGVNLTGGFYQPNTLAFFNGFSAAQQVAITPASSRQIVANLPPNSLGVPGLYPVIVQNPDAASAGIPSISAANIAVEPNPANIPTSAQPPIAVGSRPSAVAIDTALGEAVVANTGSNTVSVVNIAANSIVGGAIAVGTSPTGVAVDDALSPNIALVVNSKDNTVSTINLATNQVAGAPLALPSGFIPISIGINPLTHRAIVANQSTNVATVLDLTSGTPAIVQQITGNPVVSLSTGANPRIAIDPRLNWAVLTPGGGGTINLVDLGRHSSPGDPAGRAPELVGTFGLSSTAQGVGINAETHTALFTDPNALTLTAFSLLNNATNSISFTQGQPGFVAAAANSLANLGIAVNGNAGTAAIVDLQNNVVLQIVHVGNSPQAVAIDPATNDAVVANQGDDTVSIVSLGSIRSLHLVEASPAIAFADASSPLTLTLTGSGFAAGASQVLLDATALPAADVNVVSAREIVATVPGTMLGAAHRYIVTVENAAGPAPNVLSNAKALTVIQTVIVGASPTGVSVDTDRDLAVVANSGDNTVSLVNLLTGATVSPSPIPVGKTPQGVATLPRLGLAVVSNSGSNSATVVDVTGVKNPATVQLCTGCSQPSGVAMNQDTGRAVIANEAIIPPGAPAPCSSGAGVIAFVTLNGASGTFSGDSCVDQSPTSAAVDPGLDLAAIGTSSQSSTFDILNLTNNQIAGRLQNFQNPSGIVFDPVNQVFVAADSLSNNIVIVDPVTFTAIPAGVGINPTSIDYNFQTSTLVLANNASNTVSLVEYVCPPNGTSPACTSPQVRAVLGLTGSPQFAVAVDPRLNLAVIADQNNNRVLLVPLP